MSSTKCVGITALTALAVMASVAPSALAATVTLSIVPDGTVTARPGHGEIKFETGKASADVQAIGDEVIAPCGGPEYGRRSAAAGHAQVTSLPGAASTSLSYSLDAKARVSGGHFRTVTCIGKAQIGYEPNDTEASVDAVATAVVRIHFDGGRPNVPYFLKISHSRTGAVQPDQLTGPDGKPIDLAPVGSPYPVIMSRPGQDYFLRTSVAARARNKGGCCSDQADASAQVTVSLELAPLLFGNRQVGYIRGGTQTTSYANVAVVLLNGLTHCTATLIAPRTLLTAAHCVDPYMTHDLIAQGKVTVAFGSVYSQPLFPPVAVTEVAYPDSGPMAFDKDTLSNDVAVLYVKQPVAWVGVSPATLHDGTPSWASIQAASASLIFVGFGYNVINNEQVGDGIKREAAWAISSYDDHDISFSVPGKNPCGGDSGGPGFIETSSDLLLAAITSGGDPACTYGFDTRVDAYLDWIRPHIRQ